MAFEKFVGMSVYKARGEKQWDDEKLRLVGKLTFFALRNLFTNEMQSRRTPRG